MFKNIQRGDHFIDQGGSIVIISSVTASYVIYKRKGYDYPCMCSLSRLQNDFELIRPYEEKALEKAEEANKTRMHIQSLRLQIKNHQGSGKQ